MQYHDIAYRSRYETMNTGSMKQAAVLNDLSGAGNCSLTAALPVLAALGVQAYPLPTAVLSAQTGFPGYHMRDLTEEIAPISDHWAALGLEFDAIMTGYVASEAQAARTEEFLNRFRKPGTLVLVDPVMGDGGQLYAGFTPARCAAVAALVRRATVTTPNLTEACCLVGADYARVTEGPARTVPERAAEIARRVAAMGPQTVVITGVHCADRICNVLLDDGQTDCVYAPAIGGSWSGTGDLFAAVLCGCLVQGMPALQAVQLAADFICAALTDTAPGTDRNCGTAFVKHLHLLWEATA